MFQSNRTGKWQLCLFDIKSGTQTSVINDGNNNNFPDWSLDNNWIAYVSDKGGDEEIYMAHSDGRDIRRITNDKGRDIHPYFSPDGKYILFSSTRGNGSLDIFRYTIETDKTERLTNTPEDETCARYSADMKQIVFLKNSETNDDIFVLNTSSFLSENITNTPGIQDGWPMFSTDGRWIYYSSMESGTYCLYRIKPGSKTKEKLTTAGEGEEDARACISTDGKQIIYNKRKGKTIDIRICLVEGA